MNKFLFTVFAALGLAVSTAQAKDLVVYFSAQGNTRAVAERIAALTGADIFRIEAAEPYAENPYDDSERIQNEAYNDLRPGVANLPSQAYIDEYDRIFVGSPCWWHQPAMVVCTFLENYDLSKHVVVPFITYGATTYLNETMQKIYKCTPHSVHVPETLPEDLDADDITRPGRPDDAGIAMPGNADGVEEWLRTLGLPAGVNAPEYDSSKDVSIYNTPGHIHVTVGAEVDSNTVEIYNMSGALLHRMSGNTHYTFAVPEKSVYLLSMAYEPGNRRISKKLFL